MGERLGFGSTMLLAITLQMTIVASFVPVCGELLWIDIFNWLNFSFCSIALVSQPS